ncbi:ketopantoate reductase [Arboricoccus pini]|uniref:2-dehydropantoate 2-reductase n=1 Tax=Arboricoccus pini TaxID=1963835 RepID=A0A212RD35_9PROT|nr:2-dehydropantoate 2-reductase [Arboricoccus pini]SNB70001.1 ketopantoate reductase [Arboricoccus pini]
MQICIFGAGAVGGYLAARLARAGKNVSLIARGAHLQAIRSQGLRLQTPAEDFVVHPTASDDPAALGPQDVVILSAKTPALPGIARSIAPLIHPETALVFAVNGIFWFYAHGFRPGGLGPDTRRLDPDQTLENLIGADKALGMVIYSPNTVVAPGHVQNARAQGDRFILGEARQGAKARALKVASALAGAELDVRMDPDIRRAMWTKLTLNVASSPICCLTGQTAKAAFANPEIRCLAQGLITETLAIARAHGFELDIDPEQQSSAEKTDHKPSMLQDLELGRPMEIDSQLLILKDFARQLDQPTPTLDIILPLLVQRARQAGAYPLEPEMAGT